MASSRRCARWIATGSCTLRSRPAWSASRPTSGRPPRRRPDRCSASRRPGPARRRPSSPAIAWLVDGGADPGDDRGDHVQQARRGRAPERLRRRPLAPARAIGRRARSGSGRSTRSGCEILRRCRTSPSSRSSTGSTILRAVASRSIAGRPDGASTTRSRGSSSTCGVTPADVAADPDAGPIAPRLRRLRDARSTRLGALDFDDLVARALRRRSRRTPAVLARWRDRVPRTCSSTRSRTSTGASSGWPCSSPPRRTGSSSSATTTSRSTAGGSPTSAGSSTWPAPAGPAPGRPRDELPLSGTGRERAVRLVERNASGSRRRIRARPGRDRAASSSPRTTRTRSSGSERILDGWPDDDGTRAVLARTNRELLPALVVALERRHPVPCRSRRRRRSRIRASTRSWPSAAVDGPSLPLLVRLAGRGAVAARPWASHRRASDGRGVHAGAELGREALLAWAVRRSATSTTFRAAVARPPRRSSPRSAATTHGSASRRPTRRRASSSTTWSSSAWRRAASRAPARSPTRWIPDRALEEERRLAYVAWTRARRTLTLSYDPERRLAVPRRGVRRAERARPPPALSQSARIR